MSKRDFKKYLSTLTKKQLEEQLVEIYEKFTPVKVFYDFVFNPKEEKLLQEAKLKISNEYFPTKITKRVKPKMRRSVAQKYIKHFIHLGVDPNIIADLMLYNIEIVQVFLTYNSAKQELFYKSMFNSFDQAIRFLISNGILSDFKPRAIKIYEQAKVQRWKNESDFELILDKIEGIKL